MGTAGGPFVTIGETEDPTPTVDVRRYSETGADHAGGSGAIGCRTKRKQVGLVFSRKPPLRAVGSDPDYRFTLANERTFLAWVRTGLALLAGAVALASLVHDFGPRPLRMAITTFLLALSLIVTIGAYVRWDRTERALRENRSLPTDPLPRIMVAGVAIVTAAAAALVFLAETAP